MGLLVGLSGLTAASCATTDTTATTAVVPMSLTVDPTTFLGSVACGREPGAMKSYVATLTDITPSTLPVALPSSPPTPCSQPISFRYVVDQHTYDVVIDGYDKGASELIPCGGAESGSRTMLPAPADPAHPACADALTAGAVPVAPRWRTACGESPSRPLANTEVIAACSHALDALGAPTSVTAIKVDPNAALGMLACVKKDGVAQPGGTITGVDIKADDAGLTSYLNVECGSPPTLYTTNIVPDTTYSFHLAAYDGATLATYTSTCSAKAREGFTVTAACAPFTQP